MNYKNRVQKYLEDMEDLGKANKNAACDFLGLSLSTLEIRLDEHDTTWYALLDKQRKARCAAWVIQHRSHTADEMAKSYGSASGESAAKKFKEWFGFPYMAFKSRPTKYYLDILWKAVDA